MSNKDQAGKSRKGNWTFNACDALKAMAFLAPLCHQWPEFRIVSKDDGIEFGPIPVDLLPDNCPELEALGLSLSVESHWHSAYFVFFVDAQEISIEELR